MIRAVVLAVSLCGCSAQTVKVPIATRATPPAELLAPVNMTPPVFVSPADPAASSALTPAGERRLKELLLDLFERGQAWQAWATEGAPQ